MQIDLNFDINNVIRRQERIKDGPFELCLHPAFHNTKQIKVRIENDE